MEPTSTVGSLSTDAPASSSLWAVAISNFDLSSSVFCLLPTHLAVQPLRIDHQPSRRCMRLASRPINTDISATQPLASKPAVQPGHPACRSAESNRQLLRCKLLGRQPPTVSYQAVESSTTTLLSFDLFRHGAVVPLPASHKPGQPPSCRRTCLEYLKHVPRFQYVS